MIINVFHQFHADCEFHFNLSYVQSVILISPTCGVVSMSRELRCV